MNRRSLILGVSLAALQCGCSLLRKVIEPIRYEKPLPPPPISYSQYHLEGFQWEGVSRVLVLPVLNESEQPPRSAEEIRKAFAGEMQKLGRFEIVMAPEDDTARLARVIHRTGSFDEATMLEIARETWADVILHLIVTQYSPYHPRARVGLVVQAVSPAAGKVVASVDGLWDSSDPRLEDAVKNYYRLGPRRRAFLRNHVIASDDVLPAELALNSPTLFLRFVSQEAARVLVMGNGVEKGTGMENSCPPSPVR